MTERILVRQEYGEFDGSPELRGALALLFDYYLVDDDDVAGLKHEVIDMLNRHGYPSRQFWDEELKNELTS